MTLNPILEAENVISEAIAFKYPIVTFSGGCDSLVALYLTLLQKQDVLVIFNNTGREHPKTISFVHKLAEDWNLNFRETHPRPGKSWEELWAKYHRVMFQKRVCTYYLKNEPLTHLMWSLGHGTKDFISITGRRRYESYTRRNIKPIEFRKCGFRYWMANPLWMWSRSRVWYFIRKYGLPYNPLYDKGYKRVGCVGCHKNADQMPKLRTRHDGPQSILQKMQV